MLADDLRAEPIGRGLQFGHIAGREKSVVIFAEADLLPLQFLLYAGMTVEPIGGVEGEEDATRMMIGPSTWSRM